MDEFITEIIILITTAILLIILGFTLCQDFRTDGKKMGILLIFIGISHGAKGLIFIESQQLFDLFKAVSIAAKFLVISYALGLIIMDAKSILKISKSRRKNLEK
ncbi:MAG: hypothetical protein WBA93_32490 [Microcoleaceae cyanobacterium]